MADAVKPEGLSFFQKILLGISIGLYALSLTQDAFSYSYLEEVQTNEGWILALMGGISFAGGGTLEWGIWLANPLYLLSIVFAMKKEDNAFLTVGAAFVLALDFLFWEEILAAESGAMGPILSRGAGYFLWLGGIFVWAVAVYVGNWKQLAAKLK